MIERKKLRKIYGITGALVLLVVPFFIMLMNDSHELESAQSYCPFKMLTGMPCPGCGITKSLVFLYKGDIMTSLHYHLFGPATFLFCIVAIIVLTAELITRREYFKNIIYSARVGYTLGAILGVYHFVRLIDFVSHTSMHEIIRQSIWG